MSDQLPQEKIDEIKSAIADGNKIAAIKVCCEVTGLGLKESKDFIESLETEMEGTEGYTPTSHIQKKGCASVIVLCIGITSAAIPWIIKAL